MRFAMVVAVSALLVASPAWAEEDGTLRTPALTASRKSDPWRIDWMARDPAPPAAAVGRPAFAAAPPQGDAQAPLHAAAIEHSEAYQRRAKIHKYASFATLPLFATEFALGQSMYNTAPGDTSNLRGVHAAVGVGLIGLFGVNTVTGAWNLFGEGWSDKQGRTLRLVHGLLMMAADAGFVATAQTGPNSRSSRQALTYESNKVTHRNIAIASISVGTASYLLMLFANH